MSGRIPPRLALLRWKARIRRSLGRRLGLDDTVYVQSRLEEYRTYWATAAEELSARLVPLSDSVWEVRRDGRRVRLSNYVTPLDDPVALRIAGDRELCFRFAKNAGVRTPAHVFFPLERLEDAERHLLRSNGPCVVKPASDTASGLGITTGVSSPRELRNAAALASLFSRRLVIERMIPGESFRMLMLEGRLLHAVRRRGTRLVGDGRSTVEELVGDRGLAGDPLVEPILSVPGTADRVPAAGEEIVVRSLPPGVSRRRELRTEYDEDVTTSVAPSVIRDLRRLVEAMGVGLAGIDVVTPDITQPLGDSGGAVIEVNTTPGIHHHYLTEEHRRSGHVALPILRLLLERADPGGPPRDAPSTDDAAARPRVSSHSPGA